MTTSFDNYYLTIFDIDFIDIIAYNLIDYFPFWRQFYPPINVEIRILYR